eukprot:PRCOL_00005779-RA
MIRPQEVLPYPETWRPGYHARASEPVPVRLTKLEAQGAGAARCAPPLASACASTRAARAVIVPRASSRAAPDARSRVRARLQMAGHRGPRGGRAAPRAPPRGRAHRRERAFARLARVTPLPPARRPCKSVPRGSIVVHTRMRGGREAAWSSRAQSCLKRRGVQCACAGSHDRLRGTVVSA